MKKIFMLVLCCLMAMPAFGANCPATSVLSLKGIQNGRDNEFVYTNESVYNQVRECNKNGQKSDCAISSGEVYECVNNSGCEKGSYLFGEKGWLLAHRWFGGGPESVDGKILVCNSPAVWLANEPSASCPDDMKGTAWTKINFKNSPNALKNKECYRNGQSALFCCKNKENVGGVKPPVDKGKQNSCTNTEEKRSCLGKSDEAQWKEADCECVCLDPGKHWTGYACMIGQQADKKSCDGTKHGMSKTEKCPQSIVGGNMCQRTCNDGKWSNWKIISCDTTKGYEEKPKNNKCVEKSGGGNDDDGGVVPSVEDPVESFTCPGLTPSDWRTKYAKCDNVIDAYTELEEYCADEPIKVVYNKKWTELKKLASACDDKMSRITRSTATITTAAQNLDALIGNKVSAWKNAEGEFNTARLASDSIAGVVLGTAGGLITSHLVKKGQVKQGFEDISCTVGGQRVADWGDEFTVGIR